MENNYSLLSLTDMELVSISGGSVSYEIGYYVGTACRYFLIVAGVAALLAV